MKRTFVFSLVLLLALGLTVGGVGAFTPRETIERMEHSSIAWIEDDILYVAIVNDSGARERYRIQPPDERRWRRTPFDAKSVIVPGRTVMLESLQLDRDWQRQYEGELKEIELDGGRAGYQKVPVQAVRPGYDVRYYVAEADQRIDIDVDLGVLIDDRDRALSRLVIDDNYRTLNTRERGSIHIASFSGGFEFDERRNEIVYSEPHLTLELRTPRIRETDLLTFDIVYYDQRDRSQDLGGPLVLVVGSDYRFIDNAAPSPSRAR